MMTMYCGDCDNDVNDINTSDNTDIPQSYMVQLKELSVDQHHPVNGNRGGEDIVTDD